MLDIGGGSMLQHSVKAFLAHPRISEVIVVMPAGSTALTLAGVDPARVPPVRVVAGGERRQDSVANAFDAVVPFSDVVLIHDAARPFVTAGLIDRTIDAALAHGAAIAALQSRDTVKRVERRAEGAVIVDTIPRESVYLAQTPQGFRREVLAAAVAAGRSGIDATDEAFLAERAGYQVHVVDGDAGNVKITTADDLEAARQRIKPLDRPSPSRDRHDLHRPSRARLHRRRRRSVGPWRPGAFRRRRRVSRGDRRDPWRREPGRHRPSLPGQRSEVEGRRQPGPAARGGANGPRAGLRDRQRGRHRDPGAPEDQGSD
jgi:2-C-methyl-D-erythritol 4-phosphate cytidylyltransferase